MKKLLLIGSSGYIGSRFFYDYKNKYKITCVDLNLFYKNKKQKTIKEDYANLSKSFIDKFDVIILLAGHSSVGMSLGDPLPVINNNFINFIKLSDKINSNKKFIYASSSSVYGMSKDVLAKEDFNLEPAINNYDYSKQLIDSYSSFIKSNWFSLRFGTVNGWSPNFRSDIMINAMFVNYKKNNKINVSNPKINRPILGINDLCNSIHEIIKQDKKSGIYNLCSFNSTPHILGKKISNILKCNLIVDFNNSFAYDFKISNKKFIKDFKFQFKDSVESIVKELKLKYNNIDFTGTRREYFNYVQKN